MISRSTFFSPLDNNALTFLDHHAIKLALEPSIHVFADFSHCRFLLHKFRGFSASFFLTSNLGQTSKSAMMLGASAEDLFRETTKSQPLSISTSAINCGFYTFLSSDLSRSETVLPFIRLHTHYFMLAVNCISPSEMRSNGVPLISIF
jgi:hypothetical protein